MIKTPDELKDYCIVCNEVARRKDLSARAKGIYYYLATLPKNWELSQQELIKHFTEGRHSITTAFRELIETGYIEQKKVKDVNGLYKGYVYKVHWTCQKPVNQKTEIGKPTVQKTEIGKSDTTNYLPLLNTNEVNTKEVITKKTNTAEKSANIENSFSQFWENYKKKVDKEKSFKIWSKLKQEERELAIFKAKEYHESIIDKQFQKHPTTWLNGKCWNDEIVKQQSNNSQTKNPTITEQWEGKGLTDKYDWQLDPDYEEAEFEPLPEIKR